MAINLPAHVVATPMHQTRLSPTIHLRPSDNVSIAELVGVLRRNWWWIFGCAFTCAIVAYALASTVPKSYTADSPVAVEGDRIAVAALQGSLQSGGEADPMPAVRTEMQAIEARQLISQLVDELRLDQYPEFNAALRAPSFFSKVRTWLTAWIKPSGGPSLPASAHDGVVSAVIHALTLTQDGRSLVIDTAFTAQDPQLAATVVNRLIADYIAKRSERLTDADSGANVAMTQRINQVRDDIAQLESKMQVLRTTSGVVALRAGSVGQQQAEDLVTEVSKAAVARSELEATLARATAAASSGSTDELATVLSSPTISRLREQEAEASATVSDMSAQFGPSYPGLQSAQAHLAALRRELSSEVHRIVASLSTQVKAAQAHESELKRQLVDARKAGAVAQDVQAQLDQLQQDITTRRSLYGALLAGAQQTVAKPSNSTLPDVRILSVATPPSQPSAPKMALIAGFGGLTGGFFAGFVAFVRSTNRPRFRDEAEIVQATGGNLVANVSSRALRYDRNGNAPEVSRSIDAALHRLRSFAGSAPPRTVAMVGAQAGQQAAEAALAFARSAAKNGHKVLLVEYGGIGGGSARPGPGVSQYKSGASGADKDWRDAITQDPTKSIDLLFGFVLRAEPHYQMVALENLLVEISEEYDLVVLGAPNARDPEALALARCCDATILVVDMKVAFPAATHAAAAELAATSRNALGVIVLSKT